MNTHGTAPNVFDAGLPTFDYGLTATPHDVLEDVRKAQSRAPIAIGPLGPEILSYELAREILRDNRFRLPPGITLAAQGITSGPLYDKMANSLLGLDGAPHIRLRKLVSKAFTPRATSRLTDTIHEVVNGLIDRVIDAGNCDVVTDIARRYPTPIMCALIGAPREDWQLFADWTEEIFKALNFQPDANFDEAAIMRAWSELDGYVDDMVAARRNNLTDDLLSELIRAESDGDRLNLNELRMLVAGFLWRERTPRETNWRHRYRCSASTQTNGRSCATNHNSRCRRSRRACATRRRPVSCRERPPKMSSSVAICSRPAPSYSRTPLQPTEIQRSIAMLTASTLPARTFPQF